MNDIWTKLETGRRAMPKNATMGDLVSAGYLTKDEAYMIFKMQNLGGNTIQPESSGAAPFILGMVMGHIL